VRLPIACLATALLPIVASAADCTPTPGRTIGTHYDIAKATHQPGDLGTGLLMHGRVLSAAGCHPLAGVKVIHWQAGEEGRYLDRLYAWRLTDDKGGYRFETEWPALRPPHIHFLVEAPGHQPLATQWIADERVDEARFDIVLQPVSN
jgi:protocatechuate 3,4-dioxygenase beta subunit